jgi:glucose/arabinose dehydrogenase
MSRVALVALATLTAACRGSAGSHIAVSEGRLSDVVLDTVATGLDVPWALAFAPDGRLLATERTGRIRVIENGQLSPKPFATLPVAARGEAGLMGVALPPDFATTHEVYVVGTFENGGALVNRVIRLIDDNGAGVRPTTTLDNIPAAIFHAGDGISFGPDGMLYVATGDAREPSNAQSDTSLEGKILRMRRGGTPPDDNPTPGSLVYAKGGRNPQGITWLASGQLVATDHGPSGFPNEYFRRDRDELNAIAAGSNQGWPTEAGPSSNSRFAAPLVTWSSPGIAPSGAAAYTGSYEPWRNSVFVAALKGEQLRRVALAESSAGVKATRDEVWFNRAFGRLRAVAMGRDGFVYFTTSNRGGRGVPKPGDDHVLRLRPRQ